MKYNDYLTKLATRFDRLFAEIAANYNFDLCVELEIALCVAIRAILPERFGVCRGFVVPEDGAPVGDDIVIYDRSRFPTLRLLEQNTFAGKEEVPVEAACAYIEAKHTIHLNGDEKDGQSLAKAMKQLSRVKEVVHGRAAVGIADDTQNAKDEREHQIRGDLLFGAIFARNVKESKNEPVIEEPRTIREIIRESWQPKEEYYVCDEDFGISPATNFPTQPDAIVLGANNIIIPYMTEEERPVYQTPYTIPGQSILAHRIMPDMAFAVGVCSLLYALEQIQLGPMPYRNIIWEAFEVFSQSSAPKDKGHQERK